MADNTTPDGEFRRDNLVRAVYPGMEVRDQQGSGMPTLVGHFAVFNDWTEIHDRHEGHFMERIAPGAFKKTLQERRDKIKVLFEHGKDNNIGNKPLGPLETVGEDERGGVYEVPLLDTAYNRELVPGLKAGLYGSSFRFNVIREEKDMSPKRSASNPDAIPERTITEAKLLEFGPVTFPAYEGATAGVRSMTERFDEPSGTISERTEDPEALESTPPEPDESRKHSVKRSRTGAPADLYPKEETPSWRLY